MKRFWVRAAATIALCGLSVSSSARNLTPFGTQDALINQMERPLDAIGIDVRSTYARLSLASERPILAPLGALPAQPPPSPWPEVERDFKRGAFGFGLAWPDSPDNGRPTLENVRAAWTAVAPEHRIFLSFTRPDRSAALEVRKALEAAGYAVFTYLQDAHGEPPFSVAEVGAFFREAGQRLVLDTPHARASTGVWIERAAQEDFRQRETIEQAIKRLKSDAANLRRWRAQHSPWLKTDAARIHEASRPLDESLLRRARALDALLISFDEKADPRRKDLASIQFEAGWRVQGAVESPALAADDIQADAAKFRHELDRLNRDRKSFPIVAPLGGLRQLPHEPIKLTPKPPERDPSKALHDLIERRKREDSEFPRPDPRISPEDRERTRERMERAHEGPLK